MSSHFRVQSAAKWLLALALIGCLRTGVTAQETSEAEPDQTEKVADAKDSPATKVQSVNESIQLPGTTAEGRPIWPIKIFQSQLVDLVPSDYKPVAIDELSKAIQTARQSGLDSTESHLRNAFYDVRLENLDTLVCYRDRSEFVIESDQAGIFRYVLGTCNLAIDTRETVLPRLETDHKQQLIAVASGEESQSNQASINFSWSRQGRPVGVFRDFELVIPRAPQTRMVLSTPIDVNIQLLSDDCVLRTPASPPAGAEARTGQVRWYEIEAGGVSTIKIRAYRESDLAEADHLTVRDCSMSFRMGPADMRWVNRMVVQTRGGGRLPPLEVSEGIVTSTTVGDVSSEFSVTKIEDKSVIQIESPLGGLPSSDSTAVVVIRGIVSAQQQDRWLPIPTVRWRNVDVIHTAAQHRAQLILSDDQSLVAWDLPKNWTQQPQGATGIFRASGPPLDEDAEQAVRQTPWSRLSVTSQPAVANATQLKEFKLSIGDGNVPVLNGRARMSVNVDPNRIEPINVLLERDWEAVSMVIASSQRVIDVPNVTGQRRIPIWPDIDDVKDGQLTIEINARRPIKMSDSFTTIPESWLTQLPDVLTATTVAVVPPQELNWVGNTSLSITAISPDELTEAESEFFGTLPSETIVMRPDFGSVPKMTLQTPDVTFDVRTVVQLEREGSDIIESLSIQTRSANQRINNIVEVAAGALNGLPAYQWSIRGNDELPVNLPSTRIIDEGDVDPSSIVFRQADGVYKIDLGERDLRGKRLVGRRQYRVPESLTLQLPTIPGAASQAAEVLVASGLEIREYSSTVAMVPIDQSNEPEIRERMTNSTRLRYDSSGVPTVDIVPVDQDTSLTIVWQQDTLMTASSRGSDSITSRFRVSSSRPIRIEYEPDLRLTSLTFNGQKIDVSSIPQRPILLNSTGGKDTIDAVWDRTEVESTWYRQVRIPRIQVPGVTVNSSYRLIASQDTFAPVSIFRAYKSPTNDESMPVVAGTRTFLMHGDLAICFGWLTSTLVFSACWFLARRNLLIVMTVVVLATTSAVLWLPWKLAIVGWLVIPALAAGLLESSRVWRTRTVKTGNSARDDLTKDRSASNDFSYTSLLLLMAVSTLVTSASAQEGIGSAGRPVSVLVPTDAKGQAVGDKVYVPGAFHDQLFDSRLDDQPVDAAIQSATYRLELAGSGDKQEITADYVVHVPRRSSKIRLPISARLIRRVQYIQLDQSRIIRQSPDADGNAVLPLPAGDSYTLRFTLLPKVTQLGDSTELSLPIPVVGASRLFIDAERTVSSVSVLECAGKTLEPSLRRWESDLGPIDRLRVRFRTEGEAKTKTPSTISRTFWVSVGRQETTIEAEVQSNNPVGIDETLQFDVSGKPPKLVSAGWQLQSQTLIAPLKRRVTVRKIVSSATPVRLIWTMPSIVNDLTAEVDRVSMTLPDVSQVSADEDSIAESAAWYALQHDPSLRVDLIPLRDQEAPQSKDFLDRWRGYKDRGAIDQVWVGSQEATELVVQQRVAADTSCKQTQHIHLTQSAVQLRFQAQLASDENTIKRRTLVVPAGVQVHDVIIDGKSVSAPVKTVNGKVELALGESPERIVVKGSVPRRLSNNRKQYRLSLPMLEIWPAVSTEDSLLITRDRTVSVEVTRAPDNYSEVQSPLASNEQLSLGEIPVVRWTKTADADSDSTQRPSARAACTVSRNAQQPDVTQFTSLSYEGRQWELKSVFLVEQNTDAGYIDIELPKRWCNELLVSGATTWTQRPSTDPAFEIIRAAIADSEEPQILVQSKLENTEGGIAVPKIKVFGAGNQNTFVSVPRNQWRTKGVVPVALPKRLAKSLGTASDRQSYRIQRAAPLWSIELEPKTDVRTSVLVSDTQVFLQENDALVHCRWDVVPGNLNALGIRLPEGSECLGAWAADQQVSITTLDSTASAEKTSGKAVIRVPLSLSRLSQSVEVLFSVPIRMTRTNNYSPTLSGLRQDTDGKMSLSPIPALENWISIYTPTQAVRSVSEVRQRLSESREFNEKLSIDQVRALSLAASVVTAVDQSVDTLAERPRGEVATWLLPWIARYESIAASVGHQIVWEQGSEEAGVESTLSGRSIESLIASESAEASWSQLDRRIRRYADRYLDSPISLQAPVFAAGQFEGYILTDVNKASALSPPQPIQAISSELHDLRRFLRNGLTLMMVCGFLMLLWPLRENFQHRLNHPAFWLGTLGLFGCLVAPLPVALALVVVAITLPAVNRFADQRRA